MYSFTSENSLAPVGFTTPLVNLMPHLFYGLTIGTNVVLRYNGYSDILDVSNTVHPSLFSCIFKWYYTYFHRYNFCCRFINEKVHQRLCHWLQYTYSSDGV